MSISPVAAQTSARSKNDLAAQIRNAVGSLKSTTGVVVQSLNTGEILFDHEATTPLKPASVLKVLTSAAALSRLGIEFRFKTEFRAAAADVDQFGGLKSDTLSALFVKGGGDPNFTIENLWLAVRGLRRQGVRKIKSLILDDALFETAPSRKGQRAYESGANALSFNFNSITFEVCATQVGKPARVSVEPREFRVDLEGGITTTKQRQGFAIDEVSPGDSREGAPKYRLSGNIGIVDGCEVYYRSVSYPPAYLAATLRGLLGEQGINVEGLKIEYKQTPENSALLFAQDSKPLRLILDDLNHYSNNFIAGQLLFAIGNAQAYREASSLVSLAPFTLEQGLAALVETVKQLGLPKDEVSLEDGSGLSHEDRVSARVLLKALRFLYEQNGAFAEFIASLPVAGQSGTLKKRDFGLPLGVLRAKTGTINGVSSLAGYLKTQRGQTLAFVILQNGVGSKDEAVKIEDQIIRTLYNSGK